MSTPSGKYDKGGWKKYEFPPDMITAEQNEKKMKLSWPQIKRLMGKQIESRIFSSNQSGDPVTAQQWKAVSVRMQAKDMSQRINEEFIQDFIKWLTGRSTFNSTKYFEIIHDDHGVAVSKEVTLGCPWGNAPLTNLPGVSEFLDQGIDRRSKVIDYIAKLKMRGPRNLDEAYMYYKYILRKVAVDDYACYELQELADFDYPTDPKTGETVGPTDTDLPPLFDEGRYTANFMMVYSLSVQAPELAGEWILNGAKAIDLNALAIGSGIQLIDPRLVNKFVKTRSFDRLRRPGGTYVYVDDYVRNGDPSISRAEREEIARREIRERERRRRLRKAGRAPSAKMAAGATAKKGANLNEFLLGPDGRQKSRRLARRENRRDGRQDDERENTAIAMSEELFGTDEYVSFWALSPADQDYIMALLLAENAFASAANTLTSPASTDAMGGPVLFPQGRRNDAKYAYPGEETKEVDESNKAKIDGLIDLSKQIRALPGVVSDPETQRILNKIHKTIKGIKNKDMTPKVTVQNNTPIVIDNTSWIGAIKANTQMIETLKSVIGDLDVKIGNLNFGGGGGATAQSPAFEIPEAFRQRVDGVDTKLQTVVEVLRGLPVEIAKQIPRPPPVVGGIPVNPDQIMTDREEIRVGTANVHNPTGNWTVQNQKVENNYTAGDLNFGHITGESIGRGLGQTMGAPNVNVTVDASGVKVPTPQVDINVDGSTLNVPTPQVNVSLDPTKIKVPNLYPQVNVGGVNLPEGLGAEIGKNIKIPEFGVKGDVKVDLAPLTQKLDEYLSQHNESKTSLMNIQARHSKQIGEIYQELKEMRTQETTRLDTMKQILDKLTPLQTTVAGLVSKSGVDLDGDVEIKEKSLEEKLAQVVQLDEDTIGKLAKGSKDGVSGLKKEVSKLVELVNNSLFTEMQAGPGLPSRKIGLVEISNKLLEHTTYQSEILRKTLDYVPQEARDHVSPNVLSLLADRLNDPTSIFNKSEVKVAEITDKNFSEMKNKVVSIEKQLVSEEAALKLQKENLDLKRAALEKQFTEAMTSAAEKTNQERQAIEGQMIALRNQYATREAEFTAKANEFAILAHSHQNLQKAFEDFKQKAPNKARMLKETLKDVIGTDLKPIIEGSAQKVVDAIDSSLGPGVDEDNEDASPKEEESQSLSSEEKREASLVANAQQQTYQELQEGGGLEQTIPVGPPEVYIDRAALETKRTLEQLIDEQIRDNPNASVYNILRSPIEQVLQNLQPFKEEKGTTDPSEMSQEDRLKRNELFTAEAYQHNLESKFSGLPQEIKKQFVEPIAGQSPEERINAVTKGLTLLTREKNSLKESKSSFKRFTELLTNYRETINGMAEEPGWNGKSKLAEDNIGKWDGNTVRKSTGYMLDERVTLQPTNAQEMDSYVTLARIGREMMKAYSKGDNVSVQKLSEQTKAYEPFSDVLFTKESPLYKSMVEGDTQGISNALSQEGTAHLNRDYFTTSIKARTDMLYHAFRDQLDDSADESQNETQIAVARQAARSMSKSGITESALTVHPDFQKDIGNISIEETSIYTQAFMRAAMAHNMMKVNLDHFAGENKGVDLIRALGKSSNALMGDLRYMASHFEAAANDSSQLQLDQPNNPIIQQAYADRQQTIQQLSEKIYAAMSLSVLPEFRNLALPSPEVQQAYSPEELNVATEAVDTLTGLADGNIIADLQARAQYAEQSSTHLPSGKLFASQIKNAVEAIDKEGSRVLSAIHTGSKSELAKVMADLKKTVFENQMKKDFPSVFHALPVAMVA